MNRLLALDQSSRITGYSIWENGILEKYGKFNFDDIDGIKRIVKLKTALLTLIKNENISEVVLEDIQMQGNVNNVTTFKILAFVQGVILVLCNENNIPCEVVGSSTWKSVCGVKGKGRADQKRDAQRFVKEQFDIIAVQDIVDAICIGYCICKKNINQINWK